MVFAPQTNRIAPQATGVEGSARERLGVAAVGAGYWGPNLIRNAQSPATWLTTVCDMDLDVDRGPARAVNGVTRRLACTSAARRELGFRAEVGPEDDRTQLVASWRAERSVAPVGASPR